MKAQSYSIFVLITGNMDPKKGVATLSKIQKEECDSFLVHHGM